MVSAMKSKINQIFLRLSRYFALSFMTLSATVINAYAIDAGDVTHAEGLKRLLMVLAMCKIAQHVDEYLNQLGIGSPQTGGSMLDDIVVAGKTMQSGLNKLTGRGGGGGGGAGGGTLGQVYGSMFKNTLAGGAIDNAARAFNSGASAKDVAAAAMNGMRANLGKSGAGRVVNAVGTAATAFKDYKNGKVGAGSDGGGDNGVAAAAIASSGKDSKSGGGGSPGTDSKKTGSGGSGGGGGKSSGQPQSNGGNGQKQTGKSESAPKQTTTNPQSSYSSPSSAPKAPPIPPAGNANPTYSGKHLNNAGQDKGAEKDASDTTNPKPEANVPDTDPGGNTFVPSAPNPETADTTEAAEGQTSKVSNEAEAANPDGTHDNPSDETPSADSNAPPAPPVDPDVADVAGIAGAAGTAAALDEVSENDEPKVVPTTTEENPDGSSTEAATLHDRWGHIDENGQYISNQAAAETEASAQAQPEPPRSFWGAVKYAAGATAAGYAKDWKSSWTADLKNLSSGNTSVERFNFAARAANMNGYETNPDLANAKYAQYENTHNSVVERSAAGSAPVSDEMVTKAQNGTLTSREAVQNYNASGLGGGSEGPLLTRNAETNELEVSREGQAAGCVLVDGDDGQYITDTGDGRATAGYLAQSMANYSSMTGSTDATTGSREIAQYTAEQASVDTCIAALDNQNVEFVDNDMSRYLATKAYGAGFSDMKEGTQFRNMTAVDLEPRDDGQGHAISGGRVFTAEYTATDGSSKTAMFTSSDATFAISSGEVQQNNLKKYVAENGSTHWTNGPTDVKVEQATTGRVVDSRGAENLMHQVQGKKEVRSTHSSKESGGKPIQNNPGQATKVMRERTEEKRTEEKRSVFKVGKRNNKKG